MFWSLLSSVERARNADISLRSILGDGKDKEGYTVLGRASVDLRPILIDAAKAMLEE
ncbi:hypothetical protein CsSME_00043537 [Camellia sinensis var. sinensis]